MTARTHLQHIFAKTGTPKQTELLYLLRNSTPLSGCPNFHTATGCEFFLALI